MDSLITGNNGLKYKAMVGTGGIGSGMFFILNGNHTLGREESRSGIIENRQDYCKLHIISHYVKKLLGNDFDVYPLGKTGNDDTGKKLLAEMSEAGLNLEYCEEDLNNSTLFSFCFIYPDNSGGNMTTDNSASSSVDAAFIQKASPLFSKYQSEGIALAVPEVPLAAREQLLKLATENNFLRVASFTSGEMEYVMRSSLLKNVDLLALNLDEASKAASVSGQSDTIEIIRSAKEAVRRINPDLKLSVTHGKYGSWIWDGKELVFFPAIEVNVAGTAGAGDAYIAGIIAGITCGLTLREAQQLGALSGSASVTSPHTINKELNRRTLYNLTKTSHHSFSPGVINLLEEPQ